MPFDADRRAVGDLSSPAATDAVGWFAAHELRTPLQGIQGGVALLLEERGAGLSALQLEAVGLIAASAADLERCISHLAEIAAIRAAPAPPLEKLALGTLLAAPESARGLIFGPRLAAQATLDVLVAPPLASRALRHLTSLAQAAGEASGLACELETIEDDAITLTLEIARSASGDGAVVWHLAAALMQQGGGHLQSSRGATSRLTLRRAPQVPICKM